MRTHIHIGLACVAFAAWGATVTGCAGSPGVSTDALHPKVHHLVGVPFFPDSTDQCGPATLASVLTFWGAPTDPRSLREEIYLNHLRGTLPLDLLLAAEARGFKAEAYLGSTDNLREELAAGHPVIAFLDLGFLMFPQGHYVVVTGYDAQRQGFYVHSGLERDAFLSDSRFVKSWDKTSRWTLRVLPQ